MYQTQFRRSLDYFKAGATVRPLSPEPDNEIHPILLGLGPGSGER